MMLTSGQPSLSSDNTPLACGSAKTPPRLPNTTLGMVRFHARITHFINYLCGYKVYEFAKHTLFYSKCALNVLNKRGRCKGGLIP